MRQRSENRKKPATFRIFMIGDSTLYGGQYVSNSQLYARQLQSKLADQSNVDVEVLNMAANGWGPFNAFGYVKQNGCFDADLCIICLPVDDFRRPLVSLIDTPYFRDTAPPRCAYEEVLYHLNWRQRTRVAQRRSDRPTRREQITLGMAKYLELADVMQSAGAEVMIEILPSRAAGTSNDTPTYERRLVEEFSVQAEARSYRTGFPRGLFVGSTEPRIYHDGTHLDVAGHSLYAAYLLKRITETASWQRLASTQEKERFMNILGVSAYYHDSAACLVRDGRILAAAQEERFTRRKGDARLPKHAIHYCLSEGNVKAGGIDAVVFYDKPLSKLSRLLSTYSQVAPVGLSSFLLAIPKWLTDKAWIALHIERFLISSGYGRPRRFRFAEHHFSHAASAFFPSPFRDAAIITVDGVGEWATTTIGCGKGNSLELLFEQRFPHSLGMLYSAFTYFTGFKVNSGEYKLMGLAPYGEPRFVDEIREHLIEIRSDGSFWMNMEYFGYLAGLRMTNERFSKLFGGPPRKPESPITRREMDLASSIQAVTEEVLLNMVRYAKSVTGLSKLCLAGGVALNCVANGKIARSGIFDDVWIQPAAGDAGGALGAALYYWHSCQDQPRLADGQHDAVCGSRLGPAFSPKQIRNWLEKNQIPFHALDAAARDQLVAQAIFDQKVVGMFQGRMEYGPRALGNRSILADARSPKMQSYLNLATKFRESFRPFAPMVLKEDVLDYFHATSDSPYMLLVDNVRAERCIESDVDRESTPLEEWVNQPRSDIPAVTHVDNSARIQTIDVERAPRMHSIMTKFKALSGCSVIVNTSFNLRSEPIVCTPEEAFVCFMRSGIDVLVLEDFVLHKSEQEPWPADDSWKQDFMLD